MTPKPNRTPVNPAIAAQTPESEETVRYTIDLPVSLHQALAMEAVIKRTSKAAIIRQLLRESLQSQIA